MSIRIVTFSLVLFSYGAAVAQGQNGGTLCSHISTQGDQERCIRIVAGRRVDAAAVSLCSRISTNGDAVDCAAAVAGHFVDTAAANVCGRISTNGDAVRCARAVVDKTYDESELQICGRNGTNGGVVSCMETTGRRRVAQNNWQYNEYDQPRYNQAQYNQPQYSQPQYNQPQYNQPQHRASVSGRWQSTSGRVFTIPSSPDTFDIICTETNGQKNLYQGQWVNGRVGTQFTYQDANGRFATGSFSPNNPNTIRVVSDGGTTNWWSRL